MKRLLITFILMILPSVAWAADHADTLLVTSNGNDWSLYSGSYATNLLTLHAGKYTSTAANMGFLFSWGNYSTATVIDSVRLVVNSVYATDSDILLKVAANDVTSASAPADSAAWIAMLANPTTAQIDWDVSTTAGQPASVLVTSIIDELFGTGAWDGSIALMIYDDGTVANYTSLSTRSYDYLSASPVKLIIYYQSDSEATNRSWYVNSASTGNNNGQDWTNAWETVDDISWGVGSVAVGDTVWFGDGDYGNLVLSLAESGSTLSYIIKASDSVHGTDTGWSSAYGDGQATFVPDGTTSAISVTTGNWVIDGAYRTDETSGYGIVVDVAESDNEAAGIFLDSSAAGMANVTVQYVEYDGPGVGLTTASIGFRTDDTDDDFDNVTVQYCYLHDNSKVMMRLANCDSTIVDHCFFADVYSGDPSSHGGAISSYFGADDLTIRYSKFRNIEGSSAIAAIHDDTGQGCNHVRIYGNIAWYTPAWGGEQGYYDVGASAAVTNNLADGDGASDWIVYNNTIVNIPYMNSGLEVRDPETDDNYSYNNLFYNNDANATMATWTDHDYNIAINTGQMWNWELSTHEVSKSGDSPFVDWENGDFALVYDPLLVNGGYDVATALGVEATDAAGNEWGGDGYWDVGALEYQSEGTPFDNNNGYDSLGGYDGGGGYDY